MPSRREKLSPVATPYHHGASSEPACHACLHMQDFLHIGFEIASMLLSPALPTFLVRGFNFLYFPTGCNYWLFCQVEK